MCGIALQVGGLPGRQRVEQALRARGPDDVRTVDRPPYLLTTRRLAIRDGLASLEETSRRMPAEIAFNGELWNVAELCGRLGLSMQAPPCELELLGRLYEEYGTGLFELLDGMFAIVIVDESSRRIVAARDRYGVKPLFFATSGQVLRIASDVRTLVALGADVEWNERFAANLAVAGFTDSDESFLVGVHQLPAGTVLSAPLHDPTRARVEPFDVPASTVVMDDFAEAFEAAVWDCLSLTEDSEVGLLLSGGIDSSLIAAIAARQARDAGKDLVAITLVGSNHADVDAATRVADELGVRQVLVDLDGDTFLRHVPHALTSMSGYLWASLPVAFRAIRAELPALRVVICGEGADELHAGYAWHRDPASFAADLRGRVAATPYVTPLLGRLADFSLDEPELEGLLAHDVGAPLIDRHLLPLDHASMDVSMELRVPYLHRDPAAAAGTVPAEMTARAGGKPLLKRALGETGLRCANEIIDRPKIGMPGAFDRLARSARAWARTVPLEPEVLDFQRRTGLLSRFAAAYYSASLRQHRQDSMSREELVVHD